MSTSVKIHVEGLSDLTMLKEAFEKALIKSNPFEITAHSDLRSSVQGSGTFSSIKLIECKWANTNKSNRILSEILGAKYHSSKSLFENYITTICLSSSKKAERDSLNELKEIEAIREDLRAGRKPESASFRQGWESANAILGTQVPPIPDKLPKFKELLSAEFPDGICEFFRLINYDLYCDFQETVLSALRSVERQIILIIRRSLIPRVLDKRSAFRNIVKFLFKNLDDEHSSVNNILNTIGNYLKQNLHEKEKYSRRHIRYPADPGFQRFSFI